LFPKLKEINILEDYKLRLKFTDGAESIFDLAQVVGFKGIFGKLHELDEFRRVYISRNGWRTLTWPGQLDLDPVTVYASATGKSIKWVLAQKEPGKPIRKRRIKGPERDIPKRISET